MLNSENLVLAKLEFVGLVNGMLAEKVNFDRELRSNHRESLIRPVIVTYGQEHAVPHHCVSRNISASGICLVSQIEFPPLESATLELYRLKSHPVEVFAECRWSKPFGAHYWLSGWQFVTIKK